MRPARRCFPNLRLQSLGGAPAQTWYSTHSGPENQWPDSWCSVCHVAFLREHQWNGKNEGELNVKLLCHHCYETSRAMGTCVLIPDHDIADQ